MVLLVATLRKKANMLYRLMEGIPWDTIDMLRTAATTIENQDEQLDLLRERLESKDRELEEAYKQLDFQRIA